MNNSLINDKKYKIISYPGGIRLVRGFFNLKEFEELFQACINYEENNRNKFLEANEGLVLNMLFKEMPFLKEKFETIELKELLGKISNCNQADIVISEHSDYHINTLGGWHDDIEGGSYCTYKDAEDAGIHKFGIFLADASTIKNIGTQFKFNRRFIHPQIQLGDILLFPVGLKHRGYPGKLVTGVVRKIARFLNIKQSIYIRFVKKMLKEPNRRAIFFTFGRDCEVFRKFEDKNIKRASDQINLLSK
jgi:hypothetical protein